jgi:hypothetical protein
MPLPIQWNYGNGDDQLLNSLNSGILAVSPEASLQPAATFVPQDQ